jgi:magnesium chelatase family protein
MVALSSTYAFSGVNTSKVEVQVHFGSGLPKFNIVGLAAKAVSESKDRVRAAINSLGLALPAKVITVNLSPADMQKEGSHYDLAIALGMLVLMEIVPQDAIDEYIAMGELSLNGHLTKVSGVLPAAIAASKESLGIICPFHNTNEAMFASGDIRVVAPKTLGELVDHLKGTKIIPSPASPILDETRLSYKIDLADIKGMQAAKLALEIAAAGGHNMLMVGPPGSGKSMLAARLPTILPPLSIEEMLEVSMVQSIAGELDSETGISVLRPYRDPHHSSSMPSLVGGGSKARPGEVTLAHKGVLFLDELGEYPAIVLDSLRQPLETKTITIARVASHITYPADFQLVAAMNPCRCGYLQDLSRACSKAPRCGEDYQSKISGPFLDRIDLHIMVEPFNPYTNVNTEVNESSLDILKRVITVREVQKKRYEKFGFTLNNQLNGEAFDIFCHIDNECEEILKKAMEKWKLSMRSHNKILKVARTIADIAGAELIHKSHIAQALAYRSIDIR